MKKQISSKIISETWEALKNADDYYMSSWTKFNKSQYFINEIQLALNSLNEQRIALNCIKIFPLTTDELKPLSSILMNIAISGNIDNLILARECLFRYKHFSIVHQEASCIIDMLSNDSDDWSYRRAAELFFDLCFFDLLKRLLSICKKSNDDDLHEIYDDFSKKLGTGWESQ